MFRGVIEILEPYRAGKTTGETSQKYGVPRNEIVKLGSNEFPYPPPKKVREAIRDEIDRVNRYPDPFSRELKEKLSEYVGLPAGNISVGNGASEVLDTICKVFLNPLDRVVIPVPTYSMFIFLSMLRDASLEFVAAKEKGPEPEFEVETGDVIEAMGDARLLFLCSPNNPTGKVIKRKNIIKIIENTDAAVVVDEAYYEFSRETIADRIETYDNLIVVRSMSKFFGLAGLRLGYALARPETIKSLEKARLPFNVNRIAQRAAIEALGERDWFKKMAEKIEEQKEIVMKEINGIKGFEALPSKTNFLLVRLPYKTRVRDLVENLLEKGVIVRDVTGAHGLKHDYVRITIGKREENMRLISALREISSLWRA